MNETTTRQYEINNINILTRAWEFSQFIQNNANELSDEKTLQTIPHIMTQINKQKVQGWLTDTAASNWTR